MKKLSILLCLMIIFMQSVLSQKRGEYVKPYPITLQSNHVDTYFGTEVADPYKWLEDDRSDSTKNWVTSQNEATEAYLSKIPFRNDIYKRIKKLWNYEKRSAPFNYGDYQYFYKNDGLQNQFIVYRKKQKQNPEIFINPNLFSKDGTVYMSGLTFSKDGSFCAYQLTKGGSDWNTIIILNTKTKKIIGNPLKNVKFSDIAWKGNEGFYYSTYSAPKNKSRLSAKTDQHLLYFHKIGSEQSNDKLIFGSGDQKIRYVSAAITEDQQYLIISTANSTSGNKIIIQDLKSKKGPLHHVCNEENFEYSIIDNTKSSFLCLTNENAPNKKLVTIDLNHPQNENWKTLIPESTNPLSVSTGGGQLFAHYLVDAISKVYTVNTADGKLNEFPLPGLGTLTGLYGKIDDKKLYYSFSSYLTPGTIYEYDLKSKTSTLFYQSKINLDLTAFENKQVFYTSKDGTKIPMILTFKKGLNLNGNNPTLLYGYGGFNANITPSFSVSALAFVEQGGIYAVANLRGGGEYGNDWHDAGIKMKKQNVFDDFIAAGEYLIQEKYTKANLLAILGASNGGLLVGACMTQRPDLFGVCFPDVGVMDMLKYHKFTVGAGWASDYGTSDDSPEMFNYLHKYSPVHAARKKQNYPATLVITADHDDRVVPAHSFKFAATLQNSQQSTNPTLISIAINAGHGGSSPTEMIIQEKTDIYAFLFWNIGIDYKKITD